MTKLFKPDFSSFVSVYFRESSLGISNFDTPLFEFWNRSNKLVQINEFVTISVDDRKHFEKFKVLSQIAQQKSEFVFLNIIFAEFVVVALL